MDGSINLESIVRKFKKTFTTKLFETKVIRRVKLEFKEIKNPKFRGRDERDPWEGDPEIQCSFQYGNVKKTAQTVRMHLE